MTSAAEKTLIQEMKYAHQRCKDRLQNDFELAMHRQILMLEAIMKANRLGLLDIVSDLPKYCLQEFSIYPDVNTIVQENIYSAAYIKLRK